MLSEPNMLSPLHSLAFFVIICIVGALGGVGNALLSDNGFLLPRRETTSTGRHILRPGVFGNVLIGLIAAVLFWLLNTDFNSFSSKLEFTNQTARSIGGAMLAAVAGTRWLTNEVDKRLLRAATLAATMVSSPTSATRIDDASPANALAIAKHLTTPEN